MIVLGLEHQKDNEDHEGLRECELEVVTCEYQERFRKKISHLIRKNYETFRGVAGSSIDALCVDHISQTQCLIKRR